MMYVDDNGYMKWSECKNYMYVKSEFCIAFVFLKTVKQIYSKQLIVRKCYVWMIPMPLLEGETFYSILEPL